MPPLPFILDNFIVKTDERLNKSNIKLYCKPCIKVLGETEGAKKSFLNKKDRIVAYFKKCSNFFAETTPDIREKIFELVKNNNDDDNSTIGKRKGK